MDAQGNPPPPLVVVGAADDDPLARARLLPWFDAPALADSTVAVVGLGALGNEVAKDLLLGGVGTLLLIDPDTVVGANLGRCCLFTPQDAAARRRKVDAAAEGLRRLRPAGRPPAGAQLIVLPSTIEQALEDHREQLAKVDLFVGCLDGIGPRLTLCALAIHRQVPYVDGGIEGLRGRVQVSTPRGSTCYECTLNATHRAVIEQHYRCGGGAATVVTPAVPAEVSTVAVVAGVCAREVFKLLCKVEETLLSGVWYYDGWAGTAQTLDLAPSPSCSTHGSGEAGPLTVRGARPTAEGPSIEVREGTR